MLGSCLARAGMSGLWRVGCPSSLGLVPFGSGTSSFSGFEHAVSSGCAVLGLQCSPGPAGSLGSLSVCLWWPLLQLLTLWIKDVSWLSFVFRYRWSSWLQFPHVLPPRAVCMPDVGAMDDVLDDLLQDLYGLRYELTVCPRIHPDP